MELLNSVGYAHRGLHNINDGIVENSATAIRMAIEANVGIELDVQMSSDRVPMVYHDETLYRLTGQDGRLAFMKARDIGQVTYSTGDDHIMTLEECLALIGGKVPVLIEVKSHWTGMPEMEIGLIDVLSNYSGAHGVMSFDPSIIRRLQNIGGQSPFGLVTSQCPPKNWPNLTEEQRLKGEVHFNVARELEVDFIAHDIGDLNNPYLSALIRDLDIPLFSWTVKTKAMGQHAKDMQAIPIFEFTKDNSLRDFLNIKQLH